MSKEELTIESVNDELNKKNDELIFIDISEDPGNIDNIILKTHTIIDLKNRKGILI